MSQFEQDGLEMSYDKYVEDMWNAMQEDPNEPTIVDALAILEVDCYCTFSTANGACQSCWKGEGDDENWEIIHDDDCENCHGSKKQIKFPWTRVYCGCPKGEEAVPNESLLFMGEGDWHKDDDCPLWVALPLDKVDLQVVLWAYWKVAKDPQQIMKVMFLAMEKGFDPTGAALRELWESVKVN